MKITKRDWKCLACGIIGGAGLLIVGVPWKLLVGLGLVGLSVLYFIKILMEESCEK